MNLVRFTQSGTDLDVYIVAEQLVAIEEMDSPLECRLVTKADGVFGQYRVKCSPLIAVACFEAGHAGPKEIEENA